MTVNAVRLGGEPGKPLLMLGPSLGTSAVTLWSAAAPYLAQHFQVVAWDLPGHGNTLPPADGEAVRVETLAADVLALVDSEGGGAFHYAGDSVGGAVGLQLLLDAPDRVLTATLLCTGARIGNPESWAERAAAVLQSGTSSLVSVSAERWFARGFLEHEPTAGSALLHALADTADPGYVAVCEALAAFDVRERLGSIGHPVLAVAGEQDQATPPSALAEIADGVRDGRLEVLGDVAHLAPIEAPKLVADLITEHALRPRPGAGPAPAPAGTAPGAAAASATAAGAAAGGAAATGAAGGPAAAGATGSRSDAGTAVRREVLGDEHVDRATANATAFTADFQQFITDYAWGGIWTRPGLDRRARSLITLTALIARGHHEELAMHVRAARRNGVTVEEIKELILQSAIYCGVPDANTAFRIAQGVLAELGEA
ncbi:bifunctional 3-oxoadipate enol-lactonase/4-carboxymuconolactone decarboxylase PcaDC [Pseudonocardia phyllosphaerae]